MSGVIGTPSMADLQRLGERITGLERALGIDESPAPKWFTLQQEHNAADYLQARLIDAYGDEAGIGWCTELVRRLIRVLNDREPDA